MKNMRKLPIEMSDIGQGNLSAELHRTVANTNRNGTVTLRVKDWRSSEYIVELDFDAEQFANLMFDSNAYAYGAEFTAHPERVGRIREHHTELVPRELFEGIGSHSGSPRAEQIAMDWGVAQVHKPGGPYEGWNPFDVTVYCPQGGWQATFNRWVDERP